MRPQIFGNYTYAGDKARWHNEGGEELIVYSAMPALGKMSQDDINAALSALVEPAIMGLKKQSFRGAS